MNLDAETSADLMLFWRAHQNGRSAKQLFPMRPKGYRTATAQLANYAANKATAMSCRARGDVVAAQIYEQICDSIYRSLPAFARLW